MANGEFDPVWCKERHKEVDKQVARVWGDYGFGAVWMRMDKLEYKLWAIIVGLVLNLGGIFTTLLKMT